jgi:hypothetical protein
MWNLAHWWAGRSLAACAGLNVVLGVALWRRATGRSGVSFVLPLLVFGVGWLCVAAWLEWKSPRDYGRLEGAAAPPGIGLTAGIISSTGAPAPGMASPLESPSKEPPGFAGTGLPFGGQGGVPYKPL